MTWFADNYRVLQQQYAGQWILIVNQKVVFANPHFEPVYNEYKKCKENAIIACEVVLIDNGEANLY